MYTVITAIYNQYNPRGAITNNHDASEKLLLRKYFILTQSFHEPTKCKFISDNFILYYFDLSA